MLPSRNTFETPVNGGVICHVMWLSGSLHQKISRGSVNTADADFIKTNWLIFEWKYVVEPAKKLNYSRGAFCPSLRM